MAFFEELFGISQLREKASGAIVIGVRVINSIIMLFVGEASPMPCECTDTRQLKFIAADSSGTVRRDQEGGAWVLAGDVRRRETFRPGDVPNMSFKVVDPDGSVIDVMGQPTYRVGVRM